jgi:hypothetical protein
MFLSGEICPTWRCEVVHWVNQPGHWLTKVQAHGVLSPRVSEAGSARATEHSAPASNRRA